MRFGEKMKAMREDLGLSIQQAAEKIGVVYNTVKRYESGEYLPSVERQEEILKLLSIVENDSNIDEQLNDFLSKEIEAMKRIKQENYLLLPLLRSLGYCFIFTEDRRCQWMFPSGAKSCEISYAELMDDLEMIKRKMCAVIEERIEKAP